MATAATATAALRVLVGIFPGQLGTLQPLYDAYIAALPDNPPGSKAAGIAIGEATAAAMLQARSERRTLRAAARALPASTGDLAANATELRKRSLAVGWGTCGLLLCRAQTCSAPTGRTRSPVDDYAKDFNEIKEIGSLTSTTRTADETDAAIFWQDQAMALWNRIFRTLAASQNLDIVENARLFAMENLAAADALIGCWNDKYHWQFWRPITAIREADTDGNPATEADPTWLPLFDPSIPVCNPPPLFTPPFPDHPSGHASATAAFTHTLKNFFGTDRIAFSAFSNKSCTTRSFDRFSDALEEVIDARVWAGIHFRTADEQGAKLGKKVAHYMRQHYFQPVR